MIRKTTKTFITYISAALMFAGMNLGAASFGAIQLFDENVKSVGISDESSRKYSFDPGSDSRFVGASFIFNKIKQSLTSSGDFYYNTYDPMDPSVVSTTYFTLIDTLNDYITSTSGGELAITGGSTVVALSSNMQTNTSSTSEYSILGDYGLSGKINA